MTIHWSLAAALVASISLPAWAENRLLIDDFSTGHFVAKPIKKGRVSFTQTGAMLNGQRTTTLSVCDTFCDTQNPYGQGVSYRFAESKAEPGHSAFVMNAPIFTFPRIDQGYGPMHANFTAYDRIRVNFSAITQPLEFVLLLFSGSGRGIISCEVPATSQPVSVELPFDNFSMDNGGFVRGDITDTDFIYYSSHIGGVEYAATSIEASDTPNGGAIVCPKQATF